MAAEVFQLGALHAYHSGYPAWKLRPPAEFPLRVNSWRTLVTYALHGKVPERLRPSNAALFRWQDEGFDRWVARVLEPADFHHGIPGQCREAFRRGRVLGVKTVLNHATGPVARQRAILRPEYERLGLELGDAGFDEAYLQRVRDEFELADYHSCASSVVRDQLVGEGVNPEKIWIVPYGADPTVWHPGDEPRQRKPGEPFRILFAGQVSLRKGLRFLLAALEEAGVEPWELDVCGPVLDETRTDRAAYQGKVPVIYSGSLSQAALAEKMRQSDLLVLPSLEEGFGLVVVQALACGLPCAVSSMVGAKDLIVKGENGSVFKVGDPVELGEALEYWSGHRERVGTRDWSWAGPAETLLTLSLHAHGSALKTIS